MHYEFTEESRVLRSVTAYRIRATEYIESKGVKAGEMGGFVCKGSKLSKDAWVGGDAMVFESTLDGDILVNGKAVIEKSELKGMSTLTDAALLFKSEATHATLSGEAVVKWSKLLVEQTNDLETGFNLSGEATVTGSTLTNTGTGRQIIRLQELATIQDSTVTGNRLFFSGDTLIRKGTITGYEFVFVDVETADKLKLDGAHAEFKRVKKMEKVEAFVNQFTLVGVAEITSTQIKGELIEIRGTDIVLKHTMINCDGAIILNSAHLEYVYMEGKEVHVSDCASLIGRKGEEITLLDQVTVRDMVCIHTSKWKKSPVLMKDTLTGDLVITGG